MIKLFGGRLRISLLMIPAAVILLLTNTAKDAAGFAAAVILHECAHAAMASALNVRLTRFELLPYGCCAMIEGLGELKPSAECLIALAGPSVNIVCYVLARDVGGAFSDAFCSACFGLAAINLLPCAKTDGGRVVRALLANHMRAASVSVLLTVTSVLISVGITAAFVCLCLEGDINLTLPVIAAFILLSAINEHKQGRLLRTNRSALRKNVLKRGEAQVICHAVSGDCTAGKALSLMEMNRYNVFCVLDKDMCIRARTDEGEVIKKAVKEGTGARIIGR